MEDLQLYSLHFTSYRARGAVVVSKSVKNFLKSIDGTLLIFYVNYVVKRGYVKSEILIHLNTIQFLSQQDSCSAFGPKYLSEKCLEF